MECHVYPSSYAQGQGHEIGLRSYITIKAASEGISLVLTNASCYISACPGDLNFLLRFQ